MQIASPLTGMGFLGFLETAGGTTCRRHLLFDTSFFEELFLFFLEPTPHAAIRLMNERQRHITEFLFAPPLSKNPPSLSFAMIYLF